MDAEDFALELRDLVADLRGKGVESIHSENLIKYLDEAIPELATPSEASAVNLERYKAELQKWLEDHKHSQAYDLAHSVELFKSVIVAGQIALRTALVMNGGAAVALLAFAGHLASSHDPLKVRSVAPSLTIFVAGVLIAALTSGVTYLCQWFYAAQPPWRRTGFALNVSAILLGAGAYGVFAAGVWQAYRLFARF